MTSSAALKRLYASGDVDPWHCLSLVHPALPGGQVSWVLRFMDSLEARLETGVLQVFQPAWFDVTLPQQGATGQQQLQFTLGNVTGQIRRHVEAIRAAGGEVSVIYRAYVPDQLETPARVYRMTVTQVSTKGITAAITAVFKDAVNAKHPRLVYTQERFYGLRFIGG